MMILRRKRIPWTMKKISFVSVCYCFISFGVFAESYESYSPESEHVEEGEKARMWESKPEEVDSVNIQILDKISGKVFRTKANIEQKVRFESLAIQLKRAFRNSPDDSNEVYAYVIIKENERVWFSGWLFASAPAVNLFEHSVYDVRVEFSKEI